jgi:hypothetical protein
MKDNVTGKDKEFYELGKKMFDRLNPPGTIRPAPLPDWKAEYLKTVDLHCETLDELREAQADLKEARHANEKHIARIVDLQTHIENLEGGDS